jgi:hypothetical protein
MLCERRRAKLSVYCSWPGVSATMNLRLIGGEEAACDIERRRELELGALRAELLGVGLGRRELVPVEHLRLVDEPPDHRALAVVHAAAGHEAQQAFVLVHREVFRDIQGDRAGNMRHHK